MSIDSETRALMTELFDEGLLAEVLFPLKSGKEATVFCCRAGPALDRELVAVKVHRPITSRLFRRDETYQQGREILDDRARRAYQGKTELGLKVRAGIWFGRECEVIEAMHGAGADVPEPLAACENVLVMELLGDARGRAPLLKDVEVPPERAREVRDRLLENVELLLALHWVHGDLSPFNVLWWRERCFVIDFPQAVDARKNPAARALLERDLANLDRYFRPRGAGFAVGAYAADLWDRYRRARLEPAMPGRRGAAAR